MTQEGRPPTPRALEKLVPPAARRATPNVGRPVPQPVHSLPAAERTPAHGAWSGDRGPMPRPLSVLPTSPALPPGRPAPQRRPLPPR
jgi:hypothetical protein